jgi:hypothetical protein
MNRKEPKMKITQAIYLNAPPRGVRIVAGGQPAVIKLVRKGLLDLGIAVLADAKDAEFPWVNNLAYHWNGDQTNLETAGKIVGGTDDPVAVCLARRYWQATHSGKLVPGPVDIPAEEEAQEELRDPAAWPLDD